jgi:hypothetical protein
MLQAAATESYDTIHAAVPADAIVFDHLIANPSDEKLSHHFPSSVCVSDSRGGHFG